MLGLFKIGIRNHSAFSNTFRTSIFDLWSKIVLLVMSWKCYSTFRTSGFHSNSFFFLLLLLLLSIWTTFLLISPKPLARSAPNFGKMVYSKLVIILPESRGRSPSVGRNQFFGVALSLRPERRVGSGKIAHQWIEDLWGQCPFSLTKFVRPPEVGLKWPTK